MRSWYKIKKNGHGTVITKAMEEYLSQRQLMGRNPSVPAWPNYNELVIASFPVGTDAQSSEQRLREREKLFNDYGIFSEDLESFLSMVDIWCSDPSSPGYEEGKLYNITCNPKLLNMTLMHLGTKSNRPEEDPDKKGLNLLKHKDGIFLHPPAWSFGFFLTDNDPPYKFDTELVLNGYMWGTVTTEALIDNPEYSFSHPKKWKRYVGEEFPTEVFGFDMKSLVTWEFETEKYLNRGNDVDYDDQMVFYKFTTPQQYPPEGTERWPNSYVVHPRYRAIKYLNEFTGPLACIDLKILNKNTYPGYVSPLPLDKSDGADVRILGDLNSVRNNLKIKHLTRFGDNDFIPGDWYDVPWRDKKAQIQSNIFTPDYIFEDEIKKTDYRWPSKYYDEKNKLIGVDLGGYKKLKIKDIDYSQITYVEPPIVGNDFNYENGGAYAVGFEAYYSEQLRQGNYEIISVRPNSRITPPIHSEADVNMGVKTENNEFYVNVKSKFGSTWDSLDMSQKANIIAGYNVALYIEGSSGAELYAYVNGNKVGEYFSGMGNTFEIPLKTVVEATGSQVYERFPENITVTFKSNGPITYSYIGLRPVENSDRKDEKAFE